MLEVIELILIQKHQLEVLLEIMEDTQTRSEIQDLVKAYRGS